MTTELICWLARAEVVWSDVPSAIVPNEKLEQTVSQMQAAVNGTTGPQGTPRTVATTSVTAQARRRAKASWAAVPFENASSYHHRENRGAIRLSSVVSSRASPSVETKPMVDRNASGVFATRPAMR